MADKVVIEAEVKSNVGQVGKDAQSAAGEFKIMGVSLNSVKAGLVSVGTTAKASFATIRAGIISTGIGALLIAVTSLITYFTNTKRGADKLSQAFTAMGAVISVLQDRLSKVGEAISFVFSGEFRKAGEALKGTFSGIADEVEREVKAMVALKKRTQELRDADMEFMVQKAATRQEIEKARLNAEDETKSAAERLDALKTALSLEEKTTKRELELAAERLAIQKQEMALSENSAEDEERLAQLKVELIEKETASVKMRRRVVTEVNALEREILAEEKARAKEKADAIDAENKRIADAQAAKEKAQAAKEKADKEAADKEIALAKKVADEKMAADKAVKKSKEELASAVGGAIGALGGLMKEGSAAAKAAALTEIAVNTGLGFAQGLDIAQKSASGTGPAAAYAFPVFYATQVAAVLAAAAQAKSILGAGGSTTPPSIPNVSEQTPAPQMMSGAFEMTGVVEPEPLRAFVITDEMTSSQNQLANIRRRATI
tara:strand:+ start:263 stop:1732 length:1470 start_codon:yes stop_codon:yes gene_type:complete